ncbi:MAG: hypothetical protein IKW80_04600, partial [Thermoguttaceae bacterium]|nr:hypothetical protein [Thermoguttaceae bacterium]
MDLTAFIQQPVPSDVLSQSLTDPSDRETISGGVINFNDFNPKKEIVQFLRTKPEICYTEELGNLLFKLISQVCQHFQDKFGFEGMN